MVDCASIERTRNGGHASEFAPASPGWGCSLLGAPRDHLSTAHLPLAAPSIDPSPGRRGPGPGCADDPDARAAPVQAWRPARLLSQLAAYDHGQSRPRVLARGPLPGRNTGGN